MSASLSSVVEALTQITLMLNGLPWKQTKIILLFLRLYPSTAFWTLLLTEGLTSRSKENSKEYEGGRYKKQPLTRGLRQSAQGILAPRDEIWTSWKRQDQIHGIMVSLVLHPQNPPEIHPIRVGKLFTKRYLNRGPLILSDLYLLKKLIQQFKFFTCKEGVKVNR